MAARTVSAWRRRLGAAVRADQDVHFPQMPHPIIEGNDAALHVFSEGTHVLGGVRPVREMFFTPRLVRALAVSRPTSPVPTTRQRLLSSRPKIRWASSTATLPMLTWPSPIGGVRTCPLGRLESLLKDAVEEGREGAALVRQSISCFPTGRGFRSPRSFPIRARLPARKDALRHARPCSVVMQRTKRAHGELAGFSEVLEKARCFPIQAGVDFHPVAGLDDHSPRHAGIRFAKQLQTLALLGVSRRGPREHQGGLSRGCITIIS